MRWLALAAIVAFAQPCPRPAVRLATFNIEDFPRTPTQVTAAFAEIRSTGAAVVAVQEITDPRALADGARRELGPTWRAVTTDGDHHRLGLVYDTDRVELLAARSREETRVVPGARPTLEARIRVGGREERILVVHLKAGADQVGVRALQLQRLGDLVREGGEVVVLGDFNTVSDADRAGVASLARTTGLGWASEGLACTAWWERPADCRGAALDQVLATGSATAAAAGPCAEGCPVEDRCPVWRYQVSDHCPVTVDLR